MISATLRRMVRINYGFACGYCGVTETEVGASLAVEHYKPREAGGTDDIENLIYSCPMCNAYKGDTWDETRRPVLHPLLDNLAEHLRYADDGSVSGLTDAGKRHIKTLHLNRFPLVERRRARRMIEVLSGWIERETERIKSIELDVQQLKDAARKKKRR